MVASDIIRAMLVTNGTLCIIPLLMAEEETLSMAKEAIVAVVPDEPFSSCVLVSLVQCCYYLLFYCYPL